jgi:hypothetical protein
VGSCEDGDETSGGATELEGAEGIAGDDVVATKHTRSCRKSIRL